ncbi:COMM domain-containing protein 3-like [Galendromus occidentalis]|uniref:COMM domain-containing protein 3-like n=1 Tax=Galendromus occidentalis TaxID=34638 RepID=A0AAJ6QTN1_9ACAR|nr:COMM domain-containing protein 3-like [Galendromus occidentalis]
MMDLKDIISFDKTMSALNEEETSDSVFETALKAAIDRLSPGDESRLPSEPRNLDQLMFGIMAVLVEASKFGVTENTLEQELKEISGLSDSKRIRAIVTAYRDNVASFRAKMRGISPCSLGEIVDSVASVNCRLTSTEVEKLDGAGCVLKLATSEGHDDVQFHCTVSQLEDLDLTLRQATKAVEKHAQQ